MFNRDIRDRVERRPRSSSGTATRGGGRRPDQVRPRRLHHLRQLPVRPAHRPGRGRPPQRARQPRGVEGIGNYLRNSVKAVVDAYTGEVTLYAFDESDPILAAWRKAFPDLFAAKRRSSPPERAPPLPRGPVLDPDLDLRQLPHRRPGRLLPKEDFWALPDDRSGEIQRQEDSGGLTTAASVKARPYYLLTKLPAHQPEFVLVMPFTPNGKENMVSYLAANSTRATTAR